MEVGLLIVLKSNADGDSSISLKYFQKEKNNKVMDVLKVSFLFFTFGANHVNKSRLTFEQIAKTIYLILYEIC